jgi:hypothetical protein
MRDFDASSGDRFVQSKDKQTVQPVWVVKVIDGDPAALVREVRQEPAEAPEEQQERDERDA